MKRVTLGHRIQYGIYRTFESVLRLLPVGAVFTLGSLIGRIALPLAAPLRRTVMRNLRFAFGKEKSPEELEQLVREVFENTAGNLFASIRIPFLPEEKIRKSVTLTNLTILEDAIARKKGTILLIPHMGNWELLAQTTRLANLEVEVATHYRPLNNPLLNALVERRRKRRGLRLFAKKTSSHTLTSFLRENGILSILADQRIPKKGELCPFFGRPTSCSPLPALLAKRTEAEILGLHCRTLRKDHWELIFTRVEGRDSSACAANLEQAWRSAPGDIFWFQDRWKLPKVHPLRSLTRQPFPEEHTITKPIKLLALHHPGEEPPQRPEFPFPDYLISWETCTTGELETEPSPDLIIVANDLSLPNHLPAPVYTADQLLPPA